MNSPNPFYGVKAGAGGVQLPPGGEKLSRFRNWIDDLGSQFSEDYFVYQMPQAPQPGGAIAVAPGGQISLSVNIMQDSAFEWLYTTGSAWNNATQTGASIANPNILVQIADQTTSRNLFSAPMPWSACVGTAQQPFILPIPRRFMAKTTFIVTLINFDPGITYFAPNIALCGRKIFSSRGPLKGLQDRLTRYRQWNEADPFTGQQRLLSEDLFAYTIPVPGPIAAGANPVNTIVTVEADSDFEWMLTTGYATRSADGTTAAPFGSSVVTVTFQDGGAQRGLQNTDLYAGDVIGTALFPFLLTVPRMFLAKTPIPVKVQNIDTAIGLSNIYIVLWGRKIFEMD